jgi:hypothetical protein
MGGVIIDGLKDSGVVQKPAKLVASRGKYFLVIGKVRKELPMGGGIVEADLQKAVGKEVTAVVAGRNVVAVLGPGGRRPGWTCYIPVPDLFRRLHRDLQQQILDRYVAEGVISKSVAGKLANVR